MVDWSWELLTDAERMVLRRLSVFSGGASLEAAERVCAGDAVEQDQVLDLLTALTEKSLLLNDGGNAPRYRMSGTIMEYAGQRLAEAGESDLARHAHLAYFTELAETADPHLRRAEQLDWLATLEAEHDNIGAAMRGALAAGEAQSAMRLAAGAGWYWWLGGHKTEGMELLTAATEAPGEVTDETRATVYGLLVQFVSAGRGDEHQAAEWIHEAYRFSQRSQLRHPALGVVAALERMLQAPDAFLTAWELLLSDQDPWVRATSPAAARQDADHARPGRPGSGRVPGDGARRVPRAGRAVRDLVRPDRARGPDRRARRVRRRSASTTSRRSRSSPRSAPSRTSSGCGRGRRSCTGCWATRSPARPPSPRHSGTRSGSPGRTRWPSWPSRRRNSPGGAATRRRRAGNSASRRPCWATKRSRQYIRAVTHDLLGYLAEDLGEARAHRAAACEAAVAAGHAPMIAHGARRRRGPGTAPRRVRAGRAAARGERRRARTAGRSQPDVARIEQTARSRLGDARFAEAALEGTRVSWSQLAEVTLAS